MKAGNQSSVDIERLVFMKNSSVVFHFILWMKYVKYFKSVDPLELEYLL